MKQLNHILKNVATIKVVGDLTVQFNDIVFDSRKIAAQDLFVALPGVVVDGHQYIQQVVEKGASVVVCEKLPKDVVNHVTYVLVEDSHIAMAHIASSFYDVPSKKIKLIGVTGTNGKTTIATLLYDLFRKGGYKVGLLSTVKIMIGDVAYKASHTTPDVVTINSYLSQMIEEGIEYCFMEVSSHGIHQKRIEGLHFLGGVFTNLTHDHLDYHKTFAEYRDVKKVFFDGLSKDSFALTNLDDKNGSVMLQNTRAKKYSYALKSIADYKARILESQFSGLLLNIDGAEVWVKLIGSFNAYNLLAVYGVARLLGVEQIELLRLMSELESVSGRFQYTISKTNITSVIDYAHTPDALKNVLETINDIKSTSQKIITVVGCGGDRDRDKRPKMGTIAASMSDQVVFTSDNPRTEDPQLILNEIEAGVEAKDISKTLTVLDREQAIKIACKLAKENDIVLVAGKGHETYQEINGVRTDFDDKEKIQLTLNQLNK